MESLTKINRYILIRGKKNQSPEYGTRTAENHRKISPFCDWLYELIGLNVRPSDSGNGGKAKVSRTLTAINMRGYI